jgi:phenylalanyl-tRNA synthetase alpha subunit
LKRRKLITKEKSIWYALKKGPQFVAKRKKLATDVTQEHLRSGDWKDLEFKDYNFGAQGQPIAIGYVQPLLEVVFVAPALCIAFLIAKYNLKLMVFDSGARGNPEHLSSDGVQ